LLNHKYLMPVILKKKTVRRILINRNVCLDCNLYGQD